MLAYVFWHWPQPGVDAESYTAGLSKFHETLASVPSQGFRYSCAFRIRGAPWLPSGAEAYEDWYVLEDSCALDRINEAVVAGLRQQPHDHVARLAAGGTAGLYRLSQGKPHLAVSRFAAWFSKPPGAASEEFHARLLFWVSRPKTSLWRRQMALGPTPEFCLLAPDQPDLPDSLCHVGIDLIRIWPRS